MEKLGYEYAHMRFCPFTRRDMVTMRIVSHFWNELVAPIPLVELLLDHV